MEGIMPELAASCATETTTQDAGDGALLYSLHPRSSDTCTPCLFTTFLGLAGTGLPLRFSDSIWARGMARSSWRIRRDSVLS